MSCQLLTLEDRSTLFAKRADAFLVIFAVEALSQHFVELAEIAHLCGAQQLAHGSLRCAVSPAHCRRSVAYCRVRSTAARHSREVQRWLRAF